MKGPTVVWVESAEQELASIWLALPDRNKVSKATHQIDQALKRDAIGEGIKLCEGLYAIERPPLRALYEILSDDKVVRVLKVKPSGSF
jgi:mRNA-degrading endonuclease RelE of RelBE toxin-antitoxin system